ncbi:MAG: 50S ribosomal protein L35 [Planctomycetota bacterium]
MPKMKTHKGLKDRVRITRTGKVIRRKAGKSHLMSHKSGDRRRHLRQPETLKGRYAKTAKEELAGG